MAEWWHVMEFPNGETTPGVWDLRPTARELPWPNLAGQRCLDIGTADGFWAFEMERRGASHVKATDQPSPFQQRSKRNFDEAKAKLGSRVEYEIRDVFDLDGEWDVACMGYVLQMVEDPDTSPALCRACRGHARATRHRFAAACAPPIAARPARCAPRRPRVVRVQPQRHAKGRGDRRVDRRGADGDPARPSAARPTQLEMDHRRARPILRAPRKDELVRFHAPVTSRTPPGRGSGDARTWRASAEAVTGLELSPFSLTPRD